MLVLVHHHIEIHIRTAVFAVVQIEQRGADHQDGGLLGDGLARHQSLRQQLVAGVLQRDPGPCDGCGARTASAWITSQSINRVFSPRASMSM